MYYAETLSVFWSALSITYLSSSEDTVFNKNRHPHWYNLCDFSCWSFHLFQWVFNLAFIYLDFVNPIIQTFLKIFKKEPFNQSHSLVFYTNGHPCTRLYDKRDDFKCAIIDCPYLNYLDCIIRTPPTYAVYIS